MPFLIISGLIQLALVIHVLKTGRNNSWIFVISLVPLIGSLAYVLIELGPELMNSPSHRNKLKTLIDPKHELHSAEKDAKIADTFGTRTRLADTQLEEKQYALAENNYKDALQGLYEFEPNTMAKLAQAQFFQQKYSDTKSTLDTLKEHNPEHRDQDAHLLYARALENLGDTKSATEEYDALVQYYTGPEPHVHYAQMLAKQNKTSDAMALLDAVQETADLSAKHYSKLHKHWINRAARLRLELGG